MRTTRLRTSPSGGINRFKFIGYNLSPSFGHPSCCYSAKLNIKIGKIKNIGRKISADVFSLIMSF